MVRPDGGAGMSEDEYRMVFPGHLPEPVEGVEDVAPVGAVSPP